MRENRDQSGVLTDHVRLNAHARFAPIPTATAIQMHPDKIANRGLGKVQMEWGMGKYSDYSGAAAAGIMTLVEENQSRPLRTQTCLVPRSRPYQRFPHLRQVALSQ